MVFLFPGVLFRKFYFLDKNKNQFTHGHLLERFLLTILLSIFCLSSFFLFDFFCRNFLDTPLVLDLGYDDFKNIFSNLSKNEIPSNFSDKNTFIHFIFMFALLYAFSSLLGCFLYHLVRVLHLDNFLSVLRFNNEWDYLFTLPKRSVVERRPLERMKVQLDILTKCGEKETLYQGMYHNLIFNKDNEVDSITLTNVSKFIEISKVDENLNKIEDIDESINRKEFLYSLYRNYKNKIIYKKHIQSHTFLISKKDIVNINLLYIKGVKILNETDIFLVKHKRAVYVYRLLNILKILFPALMVVLLFVDVKTPYLDSFWNKMKLFIVTIGELYLLLNLFLYWLRAYYLKDINRSNLGGALLGLIIVLGVQYFAVFNILYFWGTILISIIGLVFLSFFLNKLDEKE